MTANPSTDGTANTPAVTDVPCDNVPPKPTLTARFHLGQLLATPGAIHTLQRFEVDPLSLLTRHVQGDWGDLCEVDRMANEVAVEYGNRILSSYKLKRNQGPKVLEATVWIITEATYGTLGGPRAATTFLLPSEY